MGMMWMCVSIAFIWNHIFICKIAISKEIQLKFSSPLSICTYHNKCMRCMSGALDGYAGNRVVTCEGKLAFGDATFDLLTFTQNIDNQLS